MAGTVKNIQLGKRFGFLVVLRKGPVQNHYAMWYCLCDCGKETLVKGRSLRNGRTKSCGHRRPLSERAFYRLRLKYKSRAKMDGLLFEIDVPLFRKLTSSRCFYCGVLPSQTIYYKNKTHPYIYNGLDRVNSDLGYLLTNTVPCCKTCNYMKLGHSMEYFLEHMQKILNYCKNRTETEQTLFNKTVV